MKPIINGLVTARPEGTYNVDEARKNPTLLWEVVAWDGHKAFLTPAAWHRWFVFHGVTMTITLFSDDWKLDYETARKIAIEISQGKRTYYSYALNEENPKWRKTW